ncbi:MAG TPA: methyltransferase [Dermatophilaceae bacterium]|nr:methyltransferase [Dermatophilaceae bacterium]
MTTGPSTPFSDGADLWLGRLGNLRNVVRQEVIATQVAAHLPDHGRPLRVLDIGAGQATQAIELARLGHEVTGVEPDPHMRVAGKAALGEQDDATRSRVRLVAGSVGFGGLAAALTAAGVEGGGHAAYDVVLCHGVLMYLPESRTAIAELAAALAPGGLLSLVARNADGLAMRPAMRGDWRSTVALLDELALAAQQSRDPAYTNEIGVVARADRMEQLASALADEGLDLVAHYGVRIASDQVPVDAEAPDGDELADLVEAELRLGAVDPYRRVASLVHLLARRPA